MNASENKTLLKATGRPREHWGTKIGVILAVAGSAVGLGNFLRFPGQAASYGGGIFMIPYFISLLIVGIPLCWAEWAMGRYGGARGHNSAPGVFRALWPGNRFSKYFGVLALIIPVFIYMYYVYIEVWCLSYAVDYARGHMGDLVKNVPPGEDVKVFGDFFENLIGMHHNGFPGGRLIVLTALTFFFNFFFIYRGVSKGIETFSKIAMPVLILVAIVILVRVLTLGTPNPAMPEKNVMNALGFMWNPKVPEGKTLLQALANGELWLAAAGQIFFSLSVGFGVILNYASYLRKDDDVALSGLTATGTNEFCEVVLGGMITVPLAFLFLNVNELNTGSTLSLGFYTLPTVFHRMPLGELFGALWFAMLFLAAITSSLSMLQPAISFLEEGFDLGRRASVSILGMIVTGGALIVIFFSKNLTALDTMDFWVGNFLIFFLAMIQTIIFSWIFGVRRGRRELERGAEIPVPRLFWFVIKYISPVYLVTIFIGFCWQNLPGRIQTMADSEDAHTIWMVLGFIVVMIIFVTLLVGEAGRRWDRKDKEAQP